MHPSTNLNSVSPVFSISFTLLSSDIERSKINVDQEVELTTGSYPGTVFKGKVHSIGLKADEASLTYPVEIVVLNNNGKNLNPGIFVNVSILVSKISGIISIPQSILESTEAGDFVWTVKENKALKKSVILGAFSGSAVAVKEGLNTGDQIVVLGHENLTPNCDVNIIN